MDRGFDSVGLRVAVLHDRDDMDINERGVSAAGAKLGLGDPSGSKGA